jgi:putative flippase GtrA
LLRYALVGLTSNIVLYLGYLLLTGAGIGHKTAMTLLYTLGVIQTYILNRRWTFLYRGEIPKSMLRYAASYAFGYLFNLIALFVLVDILTLRHQVVQAVLIVLVAAMVFLLQKFWVFRRSGPNHT